MICVKVSNCLFVKDIIYIHTFNKARGNGFLRNSPKHTYTHLRTNRYWPWIFENKTFIFSFICLHCLFYVSTLFCFQVVLVLIFSSNAKKKNDEQKMKKICMYVCKHVNKKQAKSACMCLRQPVYVRVCVFTSIQECIRWFIKKQPMITYIDYFLFANKIFRK